MKALGIRNGNQMPAVLDVPRPEPAAGEALVRTLRVGVDGTDHEIIQGTHGGFPPDEDFLILGHEAVGVVEATNGTDLEPGTIVAPMVRRPPPSGSNRYFERNEPDMAPPEQTVERGIDAAHGFMSEYFTSPAEYLVEVPADRASYGFLVEPISITEKALDLAFTARSSVTWEPQTALVLGNGSLGLLTVAMLEPDMEVYCLGRRDRPDPSIDLIESLGATYVDSRETPVEEFAETHEPVDLVYEATGYAKHATSSVHALGPNGVAVLLGLPDSWSLDIDVGHFHKELVMTNKALLGSVNAGPEHFDRAVETLETLPESLLSQLVTTVATPDAFEPAFRRGPDQIKAAIEFSKL